MAVIGKRTSTTASAASDRRPNAVTLRLVRRAALHGGLLATVLVLFRIEKVYWVGLEPNLLEWFLTVAPLLGIVLTLEAALLLISILCGRRPLRVLTLFVHSVAYAVGFVEHQFFLETGTQLSQNVVWYALGHVGGDLPSVLETAFTPKLGVRAVLCLLCLLLSIRAELRSRKPRHIEAPHIRPSLVAAACGLLLLFVPARINPLALPFASGFYDAKQPHRDYAVFPEPKLYEPPTLQNAGAPPPAPGTRPNIVVVLLESTRADMLPPYCNGCADIAPNLTNVAKNSVLFRDAYTVVPHTSKAIVAVHCGMYPQFNGTITEIDPEFVRARCLPTLLQDLGYRTTFMQTASGTFENRPSLLQSIGFKQWKVQEDLPAGFGKFGYFGMDEYAMLDPALEFIQQSGDQPFFLTLLSVSTHHPYATVDHPLVKRGEEYQQYLHALNHVDDFFGDFMARFRAMPSFANTVFIVLGDHGEGFNEHLRNKHDPVPYEEALRVPMMLYGPERYIGRPRLVDGMRSELDIVPTVLSLVGARWTGQLPGTNLLASDGHPTIITSCFYANYCLGMRRGNRKYVYHYWDMPTEVFDLDTDPHEARSIAATVPTQEIELAELEMLQLAAAVQMHYVP